MMILSSRCPNQWRRRSSGPPDGSRAPRARTLAFSHLSNFSNGRKAPTKLLFSGELSPEVKTLISRLSPEIFRRVDCASIPVEALSRRAPTHESKYPGNYPKSQRINFQYEFTQKPLRNLQIPESGVPHLCRLEELQSSKACCARSRSGAVNQTATGQ